MCPTLRFRGAFSAFTLVETAIAVGVIAFALVAVVALLPTGLNSIQAAAEQRMAASALRTIQARILATPLTQDASGFYQEVPGVTGARWEVGGSAGGPWRIGLNQGGHLVADSAQQAMVAIIEITPPTSRFEAGKANVRIAWPVDAQWTSAKWENARGSDEISFPFLPRWP